MCCCLRLSIGVVALYVRCEVLFQLVEILLGVAGGEIPDEFKKDQRLHDLALCILIQHDLRSLSDFLQVLRPGIAVEYSLWSVHAQEVLHLWPYHLQVLGLSKYQLPDGSREDTGCLLLKCCSSVAKVHEHILHPDTDQDEVVVLLELARC
jgi:hypothetical protein